MEKLPQVEAAKTLMQEATTWSVMKWLREKKKVREAADRANAALDKLRQQIQKGWPDELRSEYAAITSPGQPDHGSAKQQQMAGDGSRTQGMMKALRVADDAAIAARNDAEKTFDTAEKQLSARLAREGCQKAIRSWELHEKAITAASALLASK